MRRNTLSWFLLRLFLISLWVVHRHGVFCQNHSQCELYLAESTIPNAGFGVFTAIAKDVGDPIGNGDPSIPIIDIYRNNKHDKDFFYPLVDYVWDGRAMGMDREVSMSSIIDAYWPGLDCLVNSHLPLVNVAKSTPNYNEMGVHRFRHPGAGAFTPYSDGISVVSAPIPPGGEIFKDYGDVWFETRSHTFGNIPLSKDLKQTVDVLIEFYENIKPDLRSDVYDTILELKQIWDSRGLNAFPDTLKDVDQVLQAKSVSILDQDKAVRDVRWLEKHGTCMDNIVSGPSTIEGAGNGAFAKRFLEKGSIITGSPLHHIPDKSFFTMKNTRNGQTNDASSREGIHKVDEQKQLLMNYCFSHPLTTLSLCPYGAGVNYMNHNKTLVNVEVQWSKHGVIGHNDHWLEMSPKDMVHRYKSNLALDYIALRDIYPGEELFIDYGDVWERAWEQHLSSWEEAHHEWKDYHSASDYNNRHANDPVRTHQEQQNTPYPDNLSLRCHSNLREDDWQSKPNAWTNNDGGYSCRIVARDDTVNTYTVVVQESEGSYKDSFQESNVPRSMIQFFDKPFSTDLHLQHAFRQPITLADRLLPEAWKL